MTVTHGYSALGYQTKYLNGSAILDEATDTDAFGNVTEQRFNNAAVRTSRTFDTAMGRLQTIQSGTSVLPSSIQNLVYTWQSNSSLLGRRDNRSASDGSDDTQDAYNYDQMGRLFRQTTSGAVSRQLETLELGLTYDVYGNLLAKRSDVGADLDVTGYTYNTATKPHRLSSVNIGGNVNQLGYDDNGSITTYDAATGDDTFLDYDGQNNVTRITVGTTASTTTPKARDEFWYSPDGARFLGRETWNDNGTMRTAITTYLGAFEEVKPALNSGYNLFQRVQITPTVQWTRRTTLAGGAAWFYRLQHRDHLGSVDAITDSAGTLVLGAANRLSFDPFGGRRAKTWASDITLAEMQAILAIDYEDEQSPRGFTDHEMLNRTGFIHMNGRVYDPRIGRFVSADPIVQAPTFSQSYNRYAYVMNNPLAYTDPSGFYNLPPNATVYLYNGGEAGGGQNGERSDQIHCDEIASSAACYEFDSYREFRDVIQKPVNDLIRTLTTAEAVSAATVHALDVADAARVATREQVDALPLDFDRVYENADAWDTGSIPYTSWKFPLFFG